jgi:hypothetical protein
MRLVVNTGEAMFNPFSVNQFGYMNIDEDSTERRIAMGMFEKALRRAWVGRVRGTFTRKQRQVAALADWRESCGLRDGRFLGVQQVNIAEIGGSEGRATEFDIDFNPVDERTEKRWVSVAIARLLGVPLPPVELLRVGDLYFVRDGHHRISVARSLGETMIEAEVSELESPENAAMTECF